MVLLYTALLAACLAAFAPIYPRLPENLIDPSWMQAMNQAVAQGLVFGRDIVFTFGPYASLFTQAYHPDTYSLAFFYGVLLGICYAAMLVMAKRNQGYSWLATLVGFLLLLDAREALFFSYPLLLVLVAYLSTMQPGYRNPIAFTATRRFLYTLAFAFLGLLPIVKGSFLPLVLMSELACLILYFRRGEQAYALLLLALPPLTLASAWLAAGQPLAALPDYFYSMASIISGYSEAMALYPSLNAWWVTRYGVPGMILAYLVIAVLVLRSVVRTRCESVASYLVLCASIGVYLVLSFKVGFVRHDGHAMAASSALVLLTLFLKLSEIVPLPRMGIAAALTTWLIVHAIYMQTSVEGSPLSNIWGVLSGDRMGVKLKAAYASALQGIRSELPIRQVAGSMDVYPEDLAALFASGNQWSPRPIPQSYSAYTPQLAKLNEAHLSGPNAPENIAFRVKTIDNRYPSFDDGPSWPTLLTHYGLADQDERFLYFKKLPYFTEKNTTLLLEAHAKLGELVVLPATVDIVFAQIRMEPTLLGRMANTLFKTSPLYMTVDLIDGNSMSFRFIASMAGSGFILSPLVQSNADFLQLTRAPSKTLPSNGVKSLRIAPPYGGAMLWQSAYTLTLSVLQIPTTPQTLGTNTMPEAHSTARLLTIHHAK